MNHIYFTNTLLKSTKVWLAGILSILVAEALNLDFQISAGIVAILSVAQTKKETLKTVLNRFCTFSIAMIIAFCVYNNFGYTIHSFLIFLAFFIFVCHIFKWDSAIAINSVLVSHFITFGSMEKEFFINEFLLYLIGSTFAILVNLHLHQKTQYIELLKRETDEQIKILLRRMSIKIITGGAKVYNGERFKKLDHSIETAKAIAIENYMNRFLNAEKQDIEYLLMRQKQIAVLHVIYMYILKINSVTTTTDDVAGYLVKVSNSFNMGNSAIGLVDDLHTLMENLKTSELPQTREEFEDRAMLYLIMHHIEEFLMLKVKFYKEFHS